MPKAKPSEEQQAIEQALRVLKAGGLSSFWYFATRILKRKLVPHVHYDICEALQNAPDDGIREVIMLIPRGHFKSTIIDAYCAWRIVRDRSMTIILVSGSETNAIRDCMEIQQFLELPLVEQLYGVFKGAKKWSSDELIVCDRPESVRDSTVVALGRKNFKPGPHVKLLIFDDFEDGDSVTTSELIQKGQELDEWAVPMVDRPGAFRITAGTYWSDQDLHCHKEEKYGFITEERTSDGRKIKVRKNNVTRNKRRYFYKTLYNPDGSILFPEEWNEEKIAATRADMSPSTFAKQYLMDPVHREVSIFKDEDFRVVPAIPFEQYTTIVGIDMANTVSQDSDQTGHVVILVSPKFEIHLAHATGMKLDGQQQEEMLWQDEELWEKPFYGIEEDNYARGWKIGFEEHCKQKRQWPRITWINAHNRGSKDDRIFGTHNLFRSGQVTIAPGCDLFIDSALRFPLGRYRDTLDAWANAIQIAYSPRMKHFIENPDQKIPVSAAARGLMKLFKKGNGGKLTHDPKAALAH